MRKPTKNHQPIVDAARTIEEALKTVSELDLKRSNRPELSLVKTHGSNLLISLSRMANAEIQEVK